MFCSGCGTKLNDEAKFCFNCGAKIILSEKEKSDTRSSSLSEKELLYSSYMKNEILKAQIRNRVITEKQFYSKAEFYNLNQTQVNNMYNDIIEEIKIFSQYIDELYKECKEIFLSDHLIEELVNYGQVHGISKENCVAFLDYYNKVNELAEKRNVLEYVLDVFSETGSLEITVPDKLKRLKSITIETLLEQYIYEISKIVLEIDSLYKQNPEKDSLNKKQRRFLTNIATERIFIADDITRLILGYEKQSGLCEKRNQLLLDGVYKRFDDMYSKMHIVFGRRVVFDAKYFLVENAIRIASNAADNYLDKIESLDFLLPENCQFIEECFMEYIQELIQDISEIEQLLVFKLSDSIRDKINSTIQNIWNDLGELYINVEEIIQDKKIAKEERARRKQLRGRWQGGGFGVGGAIKGAATAGVMNAASGVIHSGVNLVGNAISSAISKSNIKKEIHKFCTNTEDAMGNISEIITIVFIEEIKNRFPKLLYFPDYHDSPEEKKMREDFRVAEDNKEGKAIELLIYNPYNPLNAMTIASEYNKNKSDLWTKATDNTFNVMSIQFRWFENLNKLVEEYADKIKTMFNEPEDFISDNAAIDEFGEMIKLLEGVVEVDDSNKQIYEVKQIYEQLLSKQKYVEWLNKIDEADCQQIIEMGNKYSANNDYSKAQNIFIKGTHNNNKAQAIIEEFFSDKDKSNLIKLLENFVKEQDVVLDEYSYIMTIMSKMINRDKKTLLVYVAEAHHHMLVDELIKYNADINKLYQLVGKQEVLENSKINEDYVICRNCGKKLKLNTKFCNYCGQRVE